MTRHLYRSGMDFQVLGPLRASRDGVDCEVRGAKERTLLAHLVAYAGQVVPSTALIESLWGDDPPRSAAKSLQTYVLRLRNSLEPDRHGKPRLLLTDDAGYQLAISALDTDAGRFSRLAELAGQALAGGRPEAAVEASRDALDLWRGTAYAGCEDTAFGQAEARRLDELRQSVVVTRMEAHLALGRESAVVPELERRVGEHPLRERLWELLMLAYYRSGQQAQALAAYDRVREVLADELGVDPGHGLRQLHARILAQDPTLQLARRRATLPPELRDETPLVGRDAELQVLREAWQRTLAGAPATVVDPWTGRGRCDQARSRPGPRGRPRGRRRRHLGRRFRRRGSRRALAAGGGAARGPSGPRDAAPPRRTRQHGRRAGHRHGPRPTDGVRGTTGGRRLRVGPRPRRGLRRGARVRARLARPGPRERGPARPGDRCPASRHPRWAWQVRPAHA